jgi:hypothetical protein
LDYRCVGRLEELKRGIWVLGLSSRGTGLVTILLFAGILRAMTWRAALLIAACFPVLGTAVVFRCIWDTPTQPSKPGRAVAPSALWAAVKTLARNRMFWMAAAVMLRLAATAEPACKPSVSD